ncbi:unnamed protein product, partial [Adineta steineri]
MVDHAEWLDYFTPVNFSSSNYIRTCDKFDEDELLARAKWAWNIGQNEEQYRNEHGLIYEVSVPTLLNRYFLVYESDQLPSKVPLLIFFH